MLDFNEFVEYVKENVQEYLPVEMKDADIRTDDIQKNNGIVYKAILIRKKGCDITPTIYLEQFFQEYEEKRSLKSICKEVANLAAKNQQPNRFKNLANDFTHFDFVKDKIVMQLVNTKMNEDLLNEIPHRPFNDLTIIYKVIISNVGSGIATITIKNDHLQYWGVSEEELYDLAFVNSNTLLPSKVSTISNTILQIIPEDLRSAFARAMKLDSMPQEMQMYIVTNKYNVNGPSTILYSNVLEELSERIGTDLYILPSSIHEVIVISAISGNSEDFKELVKEVNQTTLSMNEQLSDNVYIYEKNTRAILVA